MADKVYVVLENDLDAYLDYGSPEFSKPVKIFADKVKAEVFAEAQTIKLFKGSIPCDYSAYHDDISSIEDEDELLKQFNDLLGKKSYDRVEDFYDIEIPDAITDLKARQLLKLFDQLTFFEVREFDLEV